MEDGSTMNEFSIYRTTADDEWEVSFPNGSKFKNTILRLAEKYPGEVKNLIVNKDKSIFATIPVSWVKIFRPREVSEGERQKFRERMHSIDA